MPLHRLRMPLALVAAAMGLTTPALADVIDGHWCYVDGRRFSIAGSSITTPGGVQTQGEYTRHSFNYRAPPGELGAGQPILMLLRSETVLDLRVGSREAVPEVWRRCAPTTS
jgi:hypothetical protein